MLLLFGGIHGEIVAERKVTSGKASKPAALTAANIKAAGIGSNDRAKQSGE